MLNDLNSEHKVFEQVKNIICNFYKFSQINESTPTHHLRSHQTG